MPYMLYSQYKTAVVDAYRGRPEAEIEQHVLQAGTCREWLESLEVSRQVRDVLVEQVRAIEEAFAEILRDPSRVRDRESPAS